MKKIGDKSSILSPITRFQTQNPFRKPSDSSPQGPAIISNNLWKKASLKWRGSIKVGSIGLRSKNHTTIPNRIINDGKLYVLHRTKVQLTVHCFYLVDVWYGWAWVFSTSMGQVRGKRKSRNLFFSKLQLYFVAHSGIE